mgnify:CR=1 FL=1
MPYFTLDLEENIFLLAIKGLKSKYNDFSRLLCMVLRKILIIFAHRIKLYVKYQPD